jgi:hypothetical protein
MADPRMTLLGVLNKAERGADADRDQDVLTHRASNNLSIVRAASPPNPGVRWL